ITACVAIAVRDMLRGADGRLSLARARLHPASAWGMHFAHLGIAIFVTGVTLVNSYETERELRMEIGQRIEIGGYDIRFVGLESVAGPNYDATRGRFEIRRASAADGPPFRILSPEKRVYRASSMPMTEAAIDRSLVRDVYLSMGEPLDDRAWVVRAHVKPFVNWIWLGCVLMAIGGFVAAADRRYRRRVAEREARTLAEGQAA
ncbi:MAG: c-type cytochrome biogenesis protein CcmF, partial [Burkholderiales bacterium]